MKGKFFPRSGQFFARTCRLCAPESIGFLELFPCAGKRFKRDNVLLQTAHQQWLKFVVRVFLPHRAHRGFHIEHIGLSDPLVIFYHIGHIGVFT